MPSSPLHSVVTRRPTAATRCWRSRLRRSDKDCLDLPTTGRQRLLDGLQGPEPHAVAHADETPMPYGLNHLRIQQLREGHQAGLEGWPFVLAARLAAPSAHSG